MTRSETFLSMLPKTKLLAFICNNSNLNDDYCFMGLIGCPFHKLSCCEITSKHWEELFKQWDDEDDRKN